MIEISLTKREIVTILDVSLWKGRLQAALKKE